MSLRRLHALSALLLALFALVHLTNHLAGLAGVETHRAVMQALRTVYRQPVVEALLLAVVSFQAVSGLVLVARGWKQRRGRIAWLQAGSGLYLAFFLLNHVGAVLAGRGLLGLDTDFHFAAAGFHVPPFAFFFAPYYFLGVLALFTHLGCAGYWHLQERGTRIAGLALAAPMLLGAVLGAVLVSMMAGAFHPVTVPPEYLAPFPRLG